MPLHSNSVSFRTPALCLAITPILLGLFFDPNALRSAEKTASQQPDSHKPVSAQPTWSGHIAQLLYNNCTTCHHPNGAGPFSLLTYEDARRWAPQIRSVTESRFMPPWLPEPGYGNFADSRRLSDDDLALIRRWVATGMAKGDSATAPVAPTYSSTWTLGKPDLILTVEQPYTLAAGGEDVFRNFVLPYPLSQTHYIRAMEILPSAPRIVHHANILIDRTAEYRHQHPSDWQQGIPGMDLVVDAGKSFDPDGHFLFWKPDTPTLVEPPHMPWRLDPGNDLILNMHLKPSGKAETIRAQIGLYFTDKPPTQLPMLLQLDRDDALDIPAGQSRFIVEDEMTLPVDVRVFGIYPHAHYLGKEMQCWAVMPGQKKQWLIWIRNWDIDRQSVYSYRQPISLPRGTVLHMRYTYDNSSANPHNPHSPPMRVRAGNRSDDEMAHLWLQVLPVTEHKDNQPDPRLLLEEAWMRSRLSKTPDDYVSLYNLGAALAGQGKLHEAADVFQNMLNNNPADGRGWNALATTTESEGDWQKAQNLYSKALAVDPKNCDARFNLARLYLNHNLSAEAETTFRTLLTQCSDDADTRSGLGSALLAQQQYGQAQAEFLRALSLDPSTATAQDLHEHLAFAYLQSGKLDDGMTQLREAIKLAPDDPAAHALLAQVLAQTGQLKEAIAEQKSALRIHSEDADGWNNLGAFEAKSGDTTAARYDFQQALRIDPHNAQAQANLVHLAPENN
jgi:tetratricopeptide (TPR) repeat protein/mono/diheme cytochrome c family protein